MERRDFLRMATLAAVAPAAEALAQTPPAGETASPSCIRVKPHAQLLGENSVAIVWMTHGNTTGYVTWSQDGWATEKKAWRETDGLKDANSRVHRAVIDGFDPRKKLEYKVHSRLFKHFGPYKVAYARDEEVLSCTLNAVLPADGAVTWAMFNDVHENLAVYDTFIPYLSDVSAFCGFNGDILNHVDDEQDVVRSLTGPLSRVTQESGLPVWYVRGNHETRGAFARNMRDYLALKHSRYYGAATIGGVRFVFLDTGEDKPDEHPAYSGLVDFDAYLDRECRWLKRETDSPDWKNARARIVMRHIPWGGRFPRLAALDNVLRDANVTLAMGAHIHRRAWYRPGRDRPYHLVTGAGPGLGKPESNRNASLVKCRIDTAGLSVKILNQTGTVVLDEKIPL